MTSESVAPRQYPWTASINGRPVLLRLMTPDDKSEFLTFAQSLPEDDLLFLSIDITRPEGVDQWARNIEQNRMKTIVAEVDGKLVGHGSLGQMELYWARHLGEIQLLIKPEFRGQGLGHLLANEVFDLARRTGLQKIVARMASDQKGALQVFERLGFRAEALLGDYVIDRNNRTHDLIVMSYDVAGLNVG